MKKYILSIFAVFILFGCKKDTANTPEIVNDKEEKIISFFKRKEVKPLPVETYHTLAWADTTLFRGAVKSILHYKLVQNESDENKPIKEFNTEPFYLASHSYYLRDRRKLKVQIDKDNVEHYHYNEKAQLIGKSHIRGSSKFFYKFWYDKDNITEAVSYEVINDTINRFYDYSKIKYEYGNEIKYYQKRYGYDTLKSISINSVKANGYLTKIRKYDDSKVTSYYTKYNNWELIKEEKRGFFERDIKYLRDSLGRITSEKWYDLDGYLENKTETTYYQYDASRDNNLEVYTYKYDSKGTRRSGSVRKEFNSHGDLEDETHRYRDDSGYIYRYYYTYDDYNNWIEKEKYYMTFDSDSNFSEKKRVDKEVRKITYYKKGEEPRIEEDFTIPNTIQVLRDSISYWATKKQKKIDAFNTAVESGDFSRSISLKQSNALKNFTPEFWTVKETAYGDLDGDGDEDAAIVYETPMGEEDSGYDQYLAIFKKNDAGSWQIWHQTSAPLLSTEGGGMMGNPFDGIEIERKAIVIHHFGGSRDKWNYTHRYRFQDNDWYLIGATAGFGAPCYDFTTFDYNVMTGNIVVDVTYETCEEVDTPDQKDWKTTFKVDQHIPLMDEFTPGDNEMYIPETDDTIYY